MKIKDLENKLKSLISLRNNSYDTAEIWKLNEEIRSLNNQRHKIYTSIPIKKRPKIHKGDLVYCEEEDQIYIAGMQFYNGMVTVYKPLSRMKCLVPTHRYRPFLEIISRNEFPFN